MDLSPELMDEVLKVATRKLCSFQVAKRYVLERHLQRSAANEARSVAGDQHAPANTASPPKTKRRSVSKRGLGAERGVGPDGHARTVSSPGAPSCTQAAQRSAPTISHQAPPRQTTQPAPGAQRPFSDAPWGITPSRDQMRGQR